ncbi:hypothetical protein D3C85_1566310 [compost metagenome]
MSRTTGGDAGHDGFAQRRGPVRDGIGVADVAVLLAARLLDGVQVDHAGHHDAAAGLLV